ncbi:MAG: hypothetical protein IPJ93_15195 [Bacteroidota bacterium]|nr:MAG: hypothetical protein IPJ93_15195 [Bacteroidota bacterium]
MIIDQTEIEISIYKKTFFLSGTNLDAMIVPIGIEIITGVSNAIPNKPYFFQMVTILLFRLVKILFLGFSLASTYV